MTAEQWPTFRADLIALFGKYLPRNGVSSDLATELDAASGQQTVPVWPAGEALLCKVPASRAGQYFAKWWHQVRVLVTADAKRYDAIQVRDLGLTAWFGLIAARCKGLQFYYWLSYPQSEGQVDRARARGPRAGMRYWFPLMQGTFGRWLLYRVVLPRADHVFVQSAQMLEDVAAEGVPRERMTAVPMGVDLELAQAAQLAPAQDPRLDGRRVIAYLGTLDRVRQIEILFQMLLQVRAQVPDVLLVLAGDTEDAEHRAWLQEQIRQLGVQDQVLWLGWLPSSQAWAYMRRAEIGLSPFPRSFLLDSASPTKAIEYMGLGMPVVANDNPDQQQVITESGGGLCVPLQSAAFAEAVVSLLNDPDTRRRMGEQGRAYVAARRGYDSLAQQVAAVYHRLSARSAA
ncbi:glycosyltransferase family 4 protein [Duganella guangzhouensis]|uniref:glycosyltransferase family 4 protein n=1 Tax=Duganella guangzhouensis TaxID=2666084 RepID=UPI001E3A28F0|nr:glycosyltransferase family 4 protein [Duganella guangzhouensis]